MKRQMKIWLIGKNAMLMKLILGVTAMMFLAGTIAVQPSTTLQAKGKNNCPVYYGCPTPPPAPTPGGGGGGKGGHGGGTDNPPGHTFAPAVETSPVLA